MGSIVGQDGVDLVGDGFDQRAKEITRDPPGGLLVQFDKGELGGSVDGDQKVDLALRGVDLGNVDVEVAERIGLELASDRRGSLDIGQEGPIYGRDMADMLAWREAVNWPGLFDGEGESIVAARLAEEPAEGEEVPAE